MIKGEEFHKRAEVGGLKSEVGGLKSELGGYAPQIFKDADVGNPFRLQTSDLIQPPPQQKCSPPQK